MSTSPSSWRSLIAGTLVLVVAATAAFSLRRPLVAWFTGGPIGDSAGQPVTGHAGPFAIEARLEPDPPRQKDQSLELTILDEGGKPVDDATVDVAYDMPAMGAMAEMKGGARVSREGSGVYRARFDVPMGSTWGLRATVVAGSRSGSQGFQMTVGSAGLTLAGAVSAPRAANASPAGSAPGGIDHYTCSMHPSVKQTGPGTCPICGMGLVPVTREQQDQGVVMIDEGRRQLIGVRMEPVVSAPMRMTFRAVGHVTYDESALSDVNLKVHGWITKLFVSETGQRVTKGQPLFSMYSPELYNAEQDFLLGLQGVSASANATTGGPAATPQRTELLAHASRQRLHLLGLADSQIDAIATSGKPSEDLAIASPASGFVIEKNVVEGASVDAGMRLYRIASLSKVWVDADVYESDLARVRVGQRATVTLDYLPGRAYEAKVAYVYPYLDPAARTGRVRIELANKELDLRPGMYASVALSSDLGTRVQVPAAAVVYTGPRRLVFVDVGGGRFRPTEVEVGIESNGMYETFAGVSPGDLVATSGVFLIAAEARISTAAKYWDTTSDLDAGSSSREAMPTGSESSPGIRPPTPMPASKKADASPMEHDFTCPMHPEVHSHGPGKCSKCGMDLVPTPPRQP